MLVTSQLGKGKQLTFFYSVLKARTCAMCIVLHTWLNRKE
jgi:hypothetical protein